MSNFNKFCGCDPNMFRVTGNNPVVIEEIFYENPQNGGKPRSFDLSVTILGNGVSKVESAILGFQGKVEWGSSIVDGYMKSYSSWRTEKGCNLTSWWDALRNSGLLTSKNGIPFDGNAEVPKKAVVMRGNIGRY